MKILDRVLLSVAALGVGIGCALAVTHVDDVTRADAYVNADVASYGGLAGTCWQFSDIPDDPHAGGYTFPALPFASEGVFIYAVNCSFKFYYANGGYDDNPWFAGIAYHWVGYQDPLNGWYAYTTDSVTEDISLFSTQSDTYIYFTSSFVRSPNEAPVWNDGDINEVFYNWLTSYASMVQTPNGQNGNVSRGIRFGTDYRHINFFDLDAATLQYGFAGIYDEFPSSYSYPGATSSFKVVLNSTVVPYAVDFHFDEDGFLCVDEILYVHFRYNLIDSANDLYFPYAMLCYGNGNMYWVGYDVGVPNGQGYSDGNYGMSDLRLPFHKWTVSGTQSLCPYYCADAFAFFGKIEAYPSRVSFGYLEKISYLYADAFAYSNYFMMEDGSFTGSAAYQEGYNYGKTDGYNDGYAVGRDDGYEEGLRVGFNQGQASVTDETTAVMNLFGAVISVPIGVLNGLSPLAIWNTPIIAIIVTFLFMGVVFMILKKVL